MFLSELFFGRYFYRKNHDYLELCRNVINEKQLIRTDSIQSIIDKLNESNKEEPKIFENVTLKYTLNYFLRGLSSAKHFERTAIANSLSQV